MQAAVRDQTSRCEELAARLESAAAAQGGAAQQRGESASALADAQEAHDAVTTDGARAAAAEKQVQAAPSGPAPEHPSPLLGRLQSDLHQVTASMPGEAILRAGNLSASSWCTTFTSRSLPQHVRCGCQHASGGSDVPSKISLAGEHSLNSCLSAYVAQHSGGERGWRCGRACQPQRVQRRRPRKRGAPGPDSLPPPLAQVHYAVICAAPNHPDLIQRLCAIASIERTHAAASRVRQFSANCSAMVLQNRSEVGVRSRSRAGVAV